MEEEALACWNRGDVLTLAFNSILRYVLAFNSILRIPILNANASQSILRYGTGIQFDVLVFHMGYKCDASAESAQRS